MHISKLVFDSLKKIQISIEEFIYTWTNSDHFWWQFPDIPFYRENEDDVVPAMKQQKYLKWAKWVGCFNESYW